MPRKILHPVGFLAIASLVVVLWWTQRDAFRGGGAIDEPLTVGTNVWSGYEPLYLARDLGHFGDSVRLVEYSSATQVIRALRNGLIDAGAITLDEFLLLRESEIDVRVVLVTDISDGGDAILAKAEIASLKDLKGKRVGAESRALGAFVLTRALQAASLTSEDVQLEQIEVDGHFAAFNEGRVDAVVTFEPVLSQLKSVGAHTVFDSSQMPGEIVDVVVARGEVITAKSVKLQILVDGWFKALAHLASDPDDASNRMAKRLALEPSEVLKSFNGLKLPSREENQLLLDADSESSLRAAVEKLGAVMKSANLLKADPDMAGLFAPQFLKAAEH